MHGIKVCQSPAIIITFHHSLSTREEQDQKSVSCGIDKESSIKYLPYCNKLSLELPGGSRSGLGPVGILSH